MRLVGHVCNNYPSSSVHKSLALALLEGGVESDFFIPIRRTGDVFKNSVQSGGGISLFHILIPNRLLKYFPLFKVFTVFLVTLYFFYKKSRRPKYFIAHNFWSDGMVCLFLKFALGIEYIVCVRNTDINFFLKYLVLYRPFQRLVCLKSKGVVFITPSLREYAVSQYASVFNCVEDKTYIIPNGVVVDYLDDMHLNNDAPMDGARIRCCYVGRLDDNKNITGIIGAVEQLRLDRGLDVCVHFVGFDREKFIERYGDVPEWATIESYTQNVEYLKRIYQRSHIFLMPSFYETFGLVYVEAITQGCWCVCSEGQGVSGLFEEFKLIVQTNPNKIEDIARAIVVAYSNRLNKDFTDNDLKAYLRCNFYWKSIAASYANICELSYED